MEKDKKMEVKPSLLAEQSNKEDCNTSPYFLECLGLIADLMSACPVDGDNLGDRQISLVNGKVVFGIVLVETNDSLFVACPTTLFAVEGQEGKIDGKLVVSMPVARFLKSSIVYVSHPDDQHRIYFLEFLLKIKDNYPSVLTPEKVSAIVEILKTTKGEIGPPKLPEGNSKLSNPAVFRPSYESKVRH